VHKLVHNLKVKFPVKEIKQYVNYGHVLIADVLNDSEEVLLNLIVYLHLFTGML
jgi:hypothetical protein